MNKSVVIIGKGPSVLKSTQEFVCSFDEVVICNFPPIEGYDQYIGNKATYHFLNANDPNPYRKEILDNLGLKCMFNTHRLPIKPPMDIFPDHDVKYIHDYGSTRVPEFKSQYKFDPSTGILAFDYFVNKNAFSLIGLVGFDFFKISERGYYYPISEVQDSHKYLYNSNGQMPFNAEGMRVRANSHDSEKSEKFVYDMIKTSGKELKFK